MGRPITRGELQVGDYVTIARNTNCCAKTYDGCVFAYPERMGETAVVASIGSNDTHIKLMFAEGYESACMPIEALDYADIQVGDSVRLVQSGGYTFSKPGDIVQVTRLLGSVCIATHPADTSEDWTFRGSDLGAVVKRPPAGSILPEAGQSEATASVADIAPGDWVQFGHEQYLIDHGDREDLDDDERYQLGQWYRVKAAADEDGDIKAYTGYEDDYHYINRVCVVAHRRDTETTPWVARIGWDVAAMQQVLERNNNQEETPMSVLDNPIKALNRKLDDDTVILRRANLENELGEATSNGEKAVLQDLYRSKRGELAQRLREAIKAEEAAEAGETTTSGKA